MKGKFINTSDKAMAAKLRNFGYTEGTAEGSNMYTFVNTGTLTFSDEDTKKISFTDKLCL